MRWRWASICQLLLLLSSITIEAIEDDNANNENDNANNEDDNANNEDDTEDGGDKDNNVTMGDGDKEAESNKTMMGCEVSGGHYIYNYVFIVRQALSCNDPYFQHITRHQLDTMEFLTPSTPGSMGATVKQMKTAAHWSVVAWEMLKLAI